MNNRALVAAVLWTGGKDSAMALHEAVASGYRVGRLVTFAPPEPEFLAHPLAVIKQQAAAIELPHHVLTIREPYEEGYVAALRRLRERMGVDCVITGDIAQIGGRPNWIRERARPVGMRVHTPLWGRAREVLLRQLRERGFRALVSCADTRRLDATWVGRELDDEAVAALCEESRRSGADACGENGEYHTLVFDGPLFRRPLALPSFSVETQGSLAHMIIEGSAPMNRAANANALTSGSDFE